MATSVYCLSTSTSQASAMVASLKAAGFSDNDISVLMADRSGTRDFAHEQHTKAPEGAVAGAGIGGTTGGVLGLLAGIGTLAIPGVGPLIAAGPIMAALSGIAVGAAVGGLTGALVGMGIPELEAKRYEGKLASGNVLLSVHAEDNDEVKRAKDIMQAQGGTDISTASEKSPPTVNVPRRDAVTPPSQVPPPVI